VAIPSELKDPTVKDILQPNDHLIATVHLDTDESLVTLKWVWHEAGNRKHRYEIGKQEFAASFCPTAADFLANGDLLVGGVDTATGNTVIQIWGVRAPTISGGPKAHPEDPPHMQWNRLAYLRTIVNDNVPGRQGPRALFGPLGGGNRAYVQFWDSKDVFQFTWGSEGIEWSSIVTGDAFPEIASGSYDAYWKGDHLDWGYVYILSDERELCRDGVVYLADTDRDGVIDTWLKALPYLGEHPELRDGTRYTNSYGIPN